MMEASPDQKISLLRFEALQIKLEGSKTQSGLRISTGAGG
jgi:hypothetical protein